MDMMGDGKHLNSQSCKYYLSNKKRNCRLERIKGKDYCVQHIISNDSGEGGNSRISCPLDPTHTCDKSKLAKHLKKCNATKIIPTESWFVEDINFQKTNNDEDMVRYLREVTVAECRTLIKKLKLIEPMKLNPSIVKLHDAFSEDIKNSVNSTSALRQITQNANLLEVMRQHKLIIHPACYVEFGAGRGQLSTSVIKTIPPEERSLCCFILVDRGTNRRKLDAKHRQCGDILMKRIRADIKDLCLSQIEDLPPLPLIGISKHLCGAATDFALRCVVQTSPEKGFHGGIIALCCHHRSLWTQYCGKEYFHELGLTARDFSIIVLMSSWAVCCFKPNESANPIPDDVNRVDFLSNSEKEEIGLICKNLIDRGRIDYMLQNGYECFLLEYTQKSVSLENVALVFKSKY